MKNILQICGSLRVGGIENVVRYIGLNLDKDQYHVDYVVFDQKTEAYEPELTEHGCKVYHISKPSDGYINYIKNLKRIMSEKDYDVVHCHTMFSSFWALWVAKRMKIKKRVVHSHNYKTLEGNPPLFRRIIVWMYEHIMRCLIRIYATDYIGCSQMAGEFFFGKSFFQSKGTLVLNGIDTDRFKYNEDKRKAIRKKYELSRKFVIGNSARFTTVKNQMFLIDIFPELLKNCPEAKMLLLGEGDMLEDSKEKCRKMGIQDKVIFPGVVMNVEEYLSAMDVYVFPSLYEGMPLSIIEVQANGLPCVISDTVPPDVFLTDLIHPLSLHDKREKWVRTIIKAKRKTPLLYSEKMKTTGFDAHQMVENIRKVYER